MKLTFGVLGKAVSSNRVVRFGRGGFYTPDDVTQWKEVVAWSAKEASKLQKIDMTAQYKIHVDYYFDDNRKRDAHNCDKIIYDALEGIFFKNDTQIWEWSGKRYKGEPKVYITIETIDE